MERAGKSKTITERVVDIVIVFSLALMLCLVVEREMWRQALYSVRYSDGCDTAQCSYAKGDTALLPREWGSGRAEQGVHGGGLNGTGDHEFLFFLLGTPCETSRTAFIDGYNEMMGRLVEDGDRQGGHK